MMTKVNPVGTKIRMLRKQQDLSVDELAVRSACSTELINSLEEGALIPSLAPLLKVARGLGVRLGTFLDDKVLEEPVVVRSGAHDRAVRFSGEGGPTDHSTLDFFSLGAGKHDRHMEPFLIDVHPATPDTVKPSSHEGEEFLFVMQGAIEVLYGSRTYRVEQDDSIYYDSIVPHHVHAADNADARILAVVYAPF